LNCNHASKTDWTYACVQNCFPEWMSPMCRTKSTFRSTLTESMNAGVASSCEVSVADVPYGESHGHACKDLPHSFPPLEV